MVNPEMPSRVDRSRWARAPSTWRTCKASAARRRTSSPRAATGWPTRPGTAGAYDAEVVTVPGTDLERDESIRAGSTAAEAGRAQAGLPRRRHGHGRQLLTAERRCQRGAARLRRRRRAGRSRADGPGRVVRGQRGRPGRVRHRSGRGGEHRAEAGRDRLGRPGAGRAQRGVRRAVAGLPGRLARASTPRS